MVKTQSTSTTETQSKKPSAQSVRQWLRDAYYAIWSLVGLVLLVAAIVATFSSMSLIDMLSGTSAADQPPAQQAPEQTGPTPDQLDCIGDEVGEERLAELEQGAPAKDDETVAIQECLAQ